MKTKLKIGMKSLWIVISFFTIITCLTNCKKAGDETSGLEGIITDADTDMPLANVSVNISNNLVVETDEFGKYVFDDIPSGHYTLIAELPEYGSYSKDIEIIAGQITYLNISLTKEVGKLSGVIIDESDVAVKDASIHLRSDISDYYANTNIDGVFIFENIKPDTYELLITKQGFVSTIDTIEIAAGDELQFNKILLTPFWSEIYTFEFLYDDDWANMLITSSGTILCWVNFWGTGSEYLMKSVDGGQTFSNCTPFVYGTQIIKVFERNGTLLAFGTRTQDGQANFLGECALYRSLDNGNTWNKELDLNLYYQIDGCNIVASNDNLYYFLFYGSTSPANPTYNYKLYKSSNGGDSWVSHNPISGLSQKTKLFASNTGSIFLFYSDNGNTTQYYKSDNTGANWVEKQVNTVGIYSLFSCSKLPTNEFVTIINDNFYLSTDEGDTWSTSPCNFNKIDCVTSGGLIITVKDKLFYMSQDKGTTWELIGDNSIPSNVIIKAIRHNPADNYIYILCYSNNNRESYIYKSKISL
jgi:hypothetical protein